MREIIDVNETYYENGALSQISEKYKDGGSYHKWYYRDGHLSHEIWDFKDKPSVCRNLSYFDNGNISCEQWDLSSLPFLYLHREDGPAVTEYYKSGKVKIQQWYLNGKLHSEDGPAFIKRFPNGRLEYEKWYLNAQLHRKDGPAEIEYYPLRDGNIKKREDWYQNGEPHRADGPAVIWFDTCGRVSDDSWFYEGEQQDQNPHKQEDSNKVIYKFNGWVTEEAWKVNHRLHREDGPSLTCFYMSGNIKSQEWSLNGEPRSCGEPHRIEYHENGEVAAKEFVSPLNNLEKNRERLIYGEFNLCREIYDQEGFLDRVFYGYSRRRYFTLHREDGPAVIHYDKIGKITKEIWYCHARQIPKPKLKQPKYSKEEGWHEKEYWPNGQLAYEVRDLSGQTHSRHYSPYGRLSHECWSVDGLPHRADGPAMIYYYRSGKPKEETWFQNGEIHREDGPAMIEKCQKGGLKYETWFQNGKPHREDGPARTSYYKLPYGNNKSCEEWFQNGVGHREDGPAEIYYDVDGNYDGEVWYLHGKKIPKNKIQTTLLNK